MGDSDTEKVDQTLLDYVKDVYDLESQQYTMNQMLDSLKCEYNNEQQYLRSENVGYPLIHLGDSKSPIVAGVIIIIIGILMSLIFVSSVLQNGDTEDIVASIVMGIIPLGIGIALIYAGKSTERDNARKSKEADDYVDNQLKEIRKSNKQIKAKLEQLDVSIKRIESGLADNKKALDKLYECNVIHTKYRNFWGMSKIYDLLDTGICYKLTGVDGAYSQMRTDQIIDNQMLIIELQRGMISTNQLVAQAIDKTNNLLYIMNTQIYTQNNILQGIKNSQEISNFLLTCITCNTAAIANSTRYLALSIN
jgi:hypothetical protein